MSIQIGSLYLDDSYAPYVNINYEYYKTSSQEIIGGVQIITVAGTVSVEDSNNTKTGSIVMNRLRAIRDLGKTSGCIDINISGAQYNRGKISNVSIEQGSDPSWVNQGGFSIEVRVPLSNIPTNSLGILAADCVREFESSESYQFGEESHGGLDTGKGSKSYIRYTNSISVKCENLCMGKNSLDLALGVVKRKVQCGPSSSNPIFGQYAGWMPFLENRSLQTNTNGSVSFTCSMILVPPNSPHPNAFIDISTEEGTIYTGDKAAQTKKISGTITGLVSVPWSSLITLSDSCSSSKYDHANGIYQSIVDKYKNIGAAGGERLNPQKIPNCPSSSSSNSTAAGCGSLDKDDNNAECTKPKSITVTRQYSDGVISFVHEWGPPNADGKNDCESSGQQTDTVIEIINPQPSLVEHVLPGQGTLIQNLMCSTSTRIIVTRSITSTDSSASCPNTNPSPSCGQSSSLVTPSIPGVNSGNMKLVSSTRNSSRNSLITKQEYIVCNP